MARRGKTKGVSAQYSSAKAPSIGAAPSVQVSPISEDPNSYVTNGLQNLTNVLLQRQQQEALMQAYQQEQQAAQEAAAQKLEALRPLEGLTGQKAETLANLDASTLNNLISEGQKQAGIIQKAQALQEQFGQDPVKYGDPNFTNLDVNGYRLPDSTANMLAMNDAAYQNVAGQVSKPAITQALNTALNNLVPDRSTLNGQKAYRNYYQQFFGTGPVTDNQLLQENANLNSTLLGNQHQGIVNQYLPTQNNLGLMKDTETINGQRIDNNWKPVINAANVESTNAGTQGALIKNESDAHELQLKMQILKIMTDDSIPIKQRIATASYLQSDPQKLVSTLGELSKKGGVLGIKDKDFKEAIDTVTRETQNSNTPKSTPAPAVKPVPATPKAAGQQAGSMARGIAQGIQQAATQPREVPFNALMRDAGNLWHNTQNFFGGFGQGFAGNMQAAPAPTLPQPITLPGIRQAKQQAQANVNGLTNNINAAQKLINSGNAAISGAQKTLSDFDAHEQARRKRAQGVFTY